MYSVSTDMKQKKETVAVRLDLDAHKILLDQRETFKKTTGGDLTLSGAIRDLKKRADKVE